MARKKIPILPRDCFVCGKPMTQESEGWPIIRCVDCEVWENGTVEPKKKRYFKPLPVEWLGEWIVFIDHSKIYLPSPDMIGSQATVKQPVKPSVTSSGCLE